MPANQFNLIFFCFHVLPSPALFKHSIVICHIHYILQWYKINVLKHISSHNTVTIQVVTIGCLDLKIILSYMRACVSVFTSVLIVFFMSSRFMFIHTSKHKRMHLCYCSSWLAVCSAACLNLHISNILTI